MKKTLLLITLIVMVFSFCGCQKREEIICSSCYGKDARFYDNNLGGKISLCKDCYETFDFTSKAMNEVFSNFN